MILLISGAIIGLICGLISGIIPGIHSNAVAGIMVGVSHLLLPYVGAEGLAAALISLLITHSFVEIIPSAFFGIPDSGMALSVLPAHALTLEGRGEEAVRLGAIGCLYGVIIGIPASVCAYFFLPPIQDSIDWLTGAILVFIMGTIIIQEESPFWALLIFMSSGILGIFAFSYDYLCWIVIGQNHILMPLLTGLFGLSVILTGSHSSIPRQFFSGIRLDSPGIMSSSFSGTVAGLLVGWLPGLSTASAQSVIYSGIRYDQNRRQYLVACGAATTANAVVGFAAFYGIERMRNGVMVALSSFSPPSFVVILTMSAAVSCIAYLLVIRLSGVANLFSGINGHLLNTLVAAFVIGLTAILTGPFGLLILVCATAIGLAPGLLNLSRVTCMGAVTLPVILFSLGLGGF